jgi:hypothetical protein
MMSRFFSDARGLRFNHGINFRRRLHWETGALCGAQKVAPPFHCRASLKPGDVASDPLAGPRPNWSLRGYLIAPDCDGGHCANTPGEIALLTLHNLAHVARQVGQVIGFHGPSGLSTCRGRRGRCKSGGRAKGYRKNDDLPHGYLLRIEPNRRWHDNAAGGRRCGKTVPGLLPAIDRMLPAPLVERAIFLVKPHQTLGVTVRSEVKPVSLAARLSDGEAFFRRLASRQHHPGQRQQANASHPRASIAIPHHAATTSGGATPIPPSPAAPCGRGLAGGVLASRRGGDFQPAAAPHHRPSAASIAAASHAQLWSKRGWRTPTSRGRVTTNRGRNE